MMDKVDNSGMGNPSLPEFGTVPLIDERVLRVALSLSASTVSVLDLSQKTLNVMRFEEGNIEIERSFKNVPQSIIEEGLVHVDDTEALQCFFTQLYNGEQPDEACVRVLNTNGDWLSYQLRAAIVPSDDKHKEQVLISAHNVSLQKRVEQVYEQFFDEVTQSANHVWEFDLENNLLLSEGGQGEPFFNRAEAQTYTEILDCAGKKVPEGYRQRFEYAFGRDHLLDEFDKAHREVHLDYPVYVQDAKESMWIQGSAYMILAPDGAIHVIMCLRDITNRDKVKEVHDKANECDPLSGLLKSDVFRQKVNDVLKNDRRTQEGHLFVIDIDDFEIIEKEYGKVFCDEVVRSVSDVLTGCFRSEDMLGRVGGDEFMAFVSNIDAPRARERASEIAEALALIQHEMGEGITITLSIGIAEAGLYDGFTSLHNKAYKALYRAKSNENGSWSLWE
ncbi:MAG: diguanylate cyclase domain-containing protein [Raoultibacter sp.]|jgi:diguanylate cyclase (GGDEF)-like protein